MDLIFIHGPAATGKLTVAKEVARITGFVVFHNHLVVDALAPVFTFGSEPFIRLREEMWVGVFREAARARISTVFTFAPEASVRPRFIADAIAAVEEEGGRVRFVALTVTPEEQARRVENPDRAEHGKVNSAATLRELAQDGAFEFPPLPDGLEIDTTATPPAAAAHQIVERFGLSRAA